FPSGEGTGDPPPAAGLSLSDGTVQMTALKRSEKGDHLILRLFEPTGHPRETTVVIHRPGVVHSVRMKGFEIKTLAVHRATGAVTETDLVESDL
ncbi:MAG: alpha-mannosidase, partial [Acidobacteria bacterium]|nr:alpha-mannosidase [Acidobacteriota bacterium]